MWWTTASYIEQNFPEIVHAESIRRSFRGTEATTPARPGADLSKPCTGSLQPYSQTIPFDWNYVAPAYRKPEAVSTVTVMYITEAAARGRPCADTACIQPVR
jgi:hypothetical protein